METLPSEFAQALSRIEIDTGPAQAAQTDIRGVLVSNDELRGWGVNTILIGSYARRTGVKPGKDVDVFAKLTNLDVSSEPKTVFDLVRGVIVDHYGHRATPQDRSVKVSFDDGFSADVVPAVRNGARWAIPGKDPKDWFDTEKRWLTTDPERLTQLTTTRNQAPAVSGQGAYIPIVKLMRQIRIHHLGSNRPGGLYIEIATYWAFETTSAFGSSFAEILALTLRKVADQFDTGAVLSDPALGTAYEPALNYGELAVAARIFKGLTDKAERALEADRCEAAKLWQEVLGSNPNGRCFPIPDGCDQYGRAVPVVAAVTSRGPAEARPFA